MYTFSEFAAQRKAFTNQFFPCPGSERTVLISSYIWWTELMAYSLRKLGWNVLIAEPWYLYWIHDQLYDNAAAIWEQWLGAIRQYKVRLILGGNTTCIFPHPRTGELLHRAAGVPLVSYWWDEPRTRPPMARRGISLEQYVAAIKDERTLNAVWDADVMEELSRFMGVTNTLHVPLGSTPEFWQTPNVPMRDRPVAMCFLGNNHDEPGWEASVDPALLAWARDVAERKATDLDRSMADCVEDVGTPGAPATATAHELRREGEAPAEPPVLREPRLGGSLALPDGLPPSPLYSGERAGVRGETSSPASSPGNADVLVGIHPPRADADAGVPSYIPATSLDHEFDRWRILGGILLQRIRNRIVHAAHAHLGDRLQVIGKGWDRLGIRAAKDHSGAPQAKEHYVAAKASLNLFGGCVHGGMPIRPFEIACSNGLIFTQYNRELPSLFEPGRECIAFRDASEMREQIDRILHSPDEYDAVVQAGRRRVEADHTWEHRMERIIGAVEVRL